MEFPESVLAVVAKAVEQHPNDISAAVAAAEQEVLGLDEFEEFSGLLIHHTLQGLVYDARHMLNRRIKNDAGLYGAAPKVSGMSERVNAIHASVYAYCIGGMTLGEVKGEELEGLAASEAEIAAGHAFNVRLCTELARLVPEGKAVKQAMTEKKLRALFRTVHRTVHGEPEQATSRAGH